MTEPRISAHFRRFHKIKFLVDYLGGGLYKSRPATLNTKEVQMQIEDAFKSIDRLAAAIENLAQVIENVPVDSETPATPESKPKTEKPKAEKPKAEAEVTEPAAMSRAEFAAAARPLFAKLMGKPGYGAANVKELLAKFDVKQVVDVEPARYTEFLEAGQAELEG